MHIYALIAMKLDYLKDKLIWTHDLHLIFPNSEKNSQEKTCRHGWPSCSQCVGDLGLYSTLKEQRIPTHFGFLIMTTTDPGHRSNVTPRALCGPVRHLHVKAMPLTVKV